MRRYRFIAVGIPLILVLALGVSAMASGGSGSFSFGAKLKGYEETPAINTSGAGRFTATPTATGFSFTLTYSGLSSSAQFAHIHFGQRGVAGGVSIFLCGGSRPACPPGTGTTSATVTGTVTATDVVGPTGQGINTGDLAAVLRAIRAGVAYVNVHSSNFMTGEIRGQIRAEEDED